MTETAAAPEAQKRAAALAALDLVENDTVVGLGTGSTARYLIEELGSRLETGLLSGVRGVATSRTSEELASACGIPLVELPAEEIPLAIDGMDEVDDRLRAIKGLGGALTREKVVASAAQRFVLIGDASKLVVQLARATPIPVEVLEFGRNRTERLLERLGLEPRLRLRKGQPFTSDNGNPVLDCSVVATTDLEGLAAEIKALPGVVEHGLFLEQASLAIVAGEDRVTELRRA
ncbi:MAG TPA: ribose-5-phosphate isomerase RpiA [Trueperaceae bacterium]